MDIRNVFFLLGPLTEFLIIKQSTRTTIPQLPTKMPLWVYTTLNFYRQLAQETFLKLHFYLSFKIFIECLVHSITNVPHTNVYRINSSFSGDICLYRVIMTSSCYQIISIMQPTISLPSSVSRKFRGRIQSLSLSVVKSFPSEG